MCLDIATSNLHLIQHDATVLDRILTMDESWVFIYDPNTKQADMQWVDNQVPRPSKALCSRSAHKCMLVLFFDHVGVVHMEFLARNERINSEIYIQILRWMRESFRRKRPALWTTGIWYLHQDNAPCHVSTDLLDYFFTVDMAEWLWPHPPYSPNLAPCEKKQIRGRRFADLDELQDTVKTIFRRTPPAEFHNCFTNLSRRYQKCIQSGGWYFEGH